MTDQTPTPEPADPVDAKILKMLREAMGDMPVFDFLKTRDKTEDKTKDKAGPIMDVNVVAVSKEDLTDTTYPTTLEELSVRIITIMVAAGAPADAITEMAPRIFREVGMASSMISLMKVKEAILRTDNLDSVEQVVQEEIMSLKTVTLSAVQVTAGKPDEKPCDCILCSAFKVSESCHCRACVALN